MYFPQYFLDALLRLLYFCPTYLFMLTNFYISFYYIYIPGSIYVCIYRLYLFFAIIPVCEYANLVGCPGRAQDSPGSTTWVLVPQVYMCVRLTGTTRFKIGSVSRQRVQPAAAKLDRGATVHRLSLSIKSVYFATDRLRSLVLAL